MVIRARWAERDVLLKWLGRARSAFAGRRETLSLGVAVNYAKFELDRPGTGFAVR